MELEKMYYRLLKLCGTLTSIRSGRIDGSPPVRRIFCTPLSTKMRAIRRISSVLKSFSVCCRQVLLAIS